MKEEWGRQKDEGGRMRDEGGLNCRNIPFHIALVDDEAIFCKRIRNFLLKKSYSIDTFLTGSV